MRPGFARLYDRLVARQETTVFGAWRRVLLADVAGDVVEIGAGTGANLPHYRDAVRSLTLTEPNPVMAAQLRHRLARSPLAGRATVHEVGAEALAVGDESADVVVATLVLCSVADVDRALGEIRRVLRPGGRLVTLEHVVSSRERDRRWQRRLDPLWHWCEGSCHLDRDTAASLSAAGFDISGLDRVRVPAAPIVLEEFIRGHADR